MHSKQIQLFIFPYAGGSIASFKRVTDLLDQRIDVVTVEYSGRGTRSKEPLAASFGEMLDDATKYCMQRRKDTIPFAVMGYSMGCFLSYEALAKKLIQGEATHYFLCAEISPQTRRFELENVQNPSDDWLIERAKELGGLDERLLNDERFRELFLAPMVSDFRHLFEYRYKDYKKRIKTDTTFFYCEKDTPKADVQKWELLIDGRFDYHEMGMNHFFINQHFKEIANVINSCLIDKDC